jgi:hypothetical protein
VSALHSPARRGRSRPVVRVATGAFLYLVRSSVAVLLTAPLIYSLTLPFLLLDLWTSLYQAICFRIYGIPLVHRRDFIAIDRGRLPYLNAVERANCDYCGYVNGVLAYVREIASRTEQYWCPIKHARLVRGTHDRYNRFAPYGDARGYDATAERLRHAVQAPPQRP